MDLSIAGLLAQDGITNGAIYALLALALVLVFTVTRVIFVAPGVIAGLVYAAAPLSLAFPIQIVLTVAIVTALGPLLYRVAYQPLAEASVLVLLIVSVAAHFAMLGLGLWFFGAEGSRTQPF